MVSEEKKKCVWMTSGLISYKLCAYDYHCEECLFDKAIRNDTVCMEGQNKELFPCKQRTEKTEKQCCLMEDLFFHQNHCWVRVENPECVKIGIDSLLAGFISNIKTVVLPQTGETVTRGLYFCHIIKQRNIVPLVSPVTGSIISINDSIEKSPEILFKDYWNKGWLITVKPKNLEADLRTLVFGRQAHDWYKRKEQEIIEITNSIMNSGEETMGKTIQDGGEIIPGVFDTLKSEDYYKILESLIQGEDVK